MNFNFARMETFLAKKKEKGIFSSSQLQLGFWESSVDQILKAFCPPESRTFDQTSPHFIILDYSDHSIK